MNSIWFQPIHQLPNIGLFFIAALFLFSQMFQRLKDNEHILLFLENRYLVINMQNYAKNAVMLFVIRIRPDRYRID